MSDLATLVAMRLTHDLAGPLGAVATGVEMLDGGDPELRALVADGAAAAIASLRLHRFILAPTPDGSSAQALLTAWVATRDGVTVDWRTSPATDADLVLGLATCAIEAARRGGTAVVDGSTVTFTPAPVLDPNVVTALAGEPVTIARAALAGVLHATATRRGGTIALAIADGALCLTYHGSALPR